jgi:lysophospholipase L1-like esterase
MKKIFLYILILFSVAAQSQQKITLTVGKVYDNTVYLSPQSGDITFVDSVWWDAVPGFAKTGFTMRNPAAFVEFRTSETDFSVKVGGNWSGFGSQSEIFLLVNGVYNQSITLSADNTTQTVSITSLAAGVKDIKLVNGYAAQSAADGDINLPQAAVCVQGVVTTGNIEIKKPTHPIKRIVVDGMSITTGASGTHPTLTGWLEKLKWDDGYNMTFVSYGAKGLANNSGVFDATKASEMVTYQGACFDGTVTNEMWMDLGTNDFALSGWRFSKATWKTHVTSYVDSFHAHFPTVRLIWWAPTERTDYDTPNANGATLGDYLDALNEVAATRSSWMFIVGSRTDVSGANLSDGLHPNQTGMDEMYTARKADYLAL